MTGAEILTQAGKIISGHRTDDYGEPEDNFDTIAGLWDEYLKAKYPDPTTLKITRLDVSVMEILMKVARIAGGKGEPALDCFIDICGYSALGGQMVPDKPKE